MKFIQILYIIIAINLSIALVDNIGLVKMLSTGDENDPVEIYGMINPVDQIDAEGNVYCDSNEKKKSLTCKIRTFSHNKYFTQAGLEPSDLSALSGVGDFIYGLFLISKIFFEGVVYPGLILNAFGVPTTIQFFFTTVVYFMYILAIIQIIGNRNIGDAK